MNFCSHCGEKVSLKIPKDDDKPRFVCDICNAIHYENPKMVVGAIVEVDNKILICRRAIEPSRGKWTLPAGYLENGETISECAIRETKEEAGAKISGLLPYALINLAFINQVYFIFRAGLVGSRYQAGRESLEVELVRPDELPWTELAFRSIHEVLAVYCRDVKNAEFPFRIIDINPLG